MTRPRGTKRGRSRRNSKEDEGDQNAEPPSKVAKKTHEKNGGTVDARHLTDKRNQAAHSERKSASAVSANNAQTPGHNRLSVSFPTSSLQGYIPMVSPEIVPVSLPPFMMSDLDEIHPTRLGKPSADIPGTKNQQQTVNKSKKKTVPFEEKQKKEMDTAPVVLEDQHQGIRHRLIAVIRKLATLVALTWAAIVSFAPPKLVETTKLRAITLCSTVKELTSTYMNSEKSLFQEFKFQVLELLHSVVAFVASCSQDLKTLTTESCVLLIKYLQKSKSLASKTKTRITTAIKAYWYAERGMVHELSVQVLRVTDFLQDCTSQAKIWTLLMIAAVSESIHVPFVPTETNAKSSRLRKLVGKMIVVFIVSLCIVWGVRPFVCRHYYKNDVEGPFAFNNNHSVKRVANTPAALGKEVPVSQPTLSDVSYPSPIGFAYVTQELMKNGAGRPIGLAYVTQKLLEMDD